MRPTSILKVSVSGAVLGALVTSSGVAQAQDKPVGESATVTAATEAADAYYAITSDVRRCAAPLCGGWFLSQLNRSTTQCHDGRSSDRCYTPVLDWSTSGLSDDQQAELIEASRSSTIAGQVHAIVRGRFEPTNTTTPRPDLGQFIVAEAWVAETDEPVSGTFVWLQDNGLRCFAPPCPNLTEHTLNTSQVRDIADVNFAPAGLSDAEIEMYTAAMYGPGGLVVAGNQYTVQVNGTTAPGRTATAAYLRLGDNEPAE